MLSHVFTTPILRERTDLSPAQLAELCEYLLALRDRSPGEDKSNCGGWHSSGNLFTPEHQQFDFLREAITRALFAFVGEAFGYSGELEIAITGWAVVNGVGHFNAPHDHAANLLSGALYIAIPDSMRGGAIVFQDPRLNLAAYQTEGMRRLKIKPPWCRTTISVVPAVGEVLVFPSWLMHFVEPFQCDDPEAVRIVVSFNASA
ncbi:MAG: hypothetical protein QOD99_1176 [Chthoniobacter sp.]|nr:hypothetical protein [Chthoniobacter sp.]